MAYEKYIKKGGKIFGPYLYETKRIDGKIVTSYLGYAPPKKNIKNLNLFLFIFFGLVLIILLLLFLYHFKITGSIIAKNLDLEKNSILTDIEENSVITETNIFDENMGNVNIKIVQHGAVIGKPVRWTKNMALSKNANISIEIPLSAENISIIEVKRLDDSDDATEKLGFFKFIGFAVLEQEDLDSNIDSLNGIKKIDIEEEASEAEIEYYTDVPYTIEEKLERGKKVTVIGSDEVHYENILAFTYLDEKFNIKNKENVKIYWREGNEFINAENVADKDGDGIYDYAEWIVQSLSRQTFDIILISNAEHLNEKREFIEDIYGQVKEKDNIWANIPEGHYVRVRFERNLTSNNDIIIHARSDYDNANVEVYENNKTRLIAKFFGVDKEEDYKILLNNLDKEQDTFDLLVAGGDVEFDYIIDPSFLANDTASIRNNITIEAYPFSHITLNDSSLVFYMPFDVNNTYPANTTYDYSTRNLSGRVIGIAHWNTTGFIGGAYHFEGNSTENYINISDPNIAENLSSLTVSAWARVNSILVTGSFGIVSQTYGDNDVFFLQHSDTDEFAFAVFNSTGNQETADANADVPDTNWHHVVGVYNGTNVLIYQDGVLQTDQSILSGNTRVSSTSQLTIGTKSAGDSFNGSIDDVMIWNRSLSSEEVRTLFKNQSYRFLTPATQLFENNSVALGNNRANVTTNATLLLGSKISLRLREFSASGAWTANTTWENISDGDNQVKTFNITATTVNLTLEFDFIPFNGNQSGNFYSPVLRNSVNVTEWNESVSSSGGSSGGSGSSRGGGGGGSIATQAKPKTVLEVGTFHVSVNTIERMINVGEEIFENILVSSTDEKNIKVSIITKIDVLVDKSLANIISINNSVEIPASGSRDIKIRIFGLKPGVYIGNIYFFGERAENQMDEIIDEEGFRTAITEKIGDVKITESNYILPMRIIVKGTKSKLLDGDVIIDKYSTLPGEIFKFKVSAFNLGRLGSYDIELLYEVVDKEGDVVVSKTESTKIENSLVFDRELEIPEDVEFGDYELVVKVFYDSESILLAKQAFKIGKGPLFSPFSRAFGKVSNFVATSFSIVYLPIILAILFVIILSVVVIYYFKYLRQKLFEKKLEEIKKKSIYVFPDFKLLPKSQFAYVGHVADSGIKTYLDHTQLNRHTLIAGGTGAGKTVAGMIVVEELLRKGGFGVIVFDPTGQWTGFLKKNEDKRMRLLYRKFSVRGTKAFKTRIVEVTEKTMNLDVVYYLRKSGLTILKLDKLDSKALDKFIENSLEMIQKARLSEKGGLEHLIVLDEVHRLLPKYGGRKAYVKLEQAVREFRKWGIGLLMISQVLTDFKGAIRGNIGTEVQLRTRYEGDIKRVRDRHGSKISKLIAKLPTGLGMIECSDYNKGSPYFVEFRPLMHSPFKISEKELHKYLRKVRLFFIKENLKK